MKRIAFLGTALVAAACSPLVKQATDLVPAEPIKMHPDAGGGPVWHWNGHLFTVTKGGKAIIDGFYGKAGIQINDLRTGNSTTLRPTQGAQTVHFQGHTLFIDDTGAAWGHDKTGKLVCTVAYDGTNWVVTSHLSNMTGGIAPWALPPHPNITIGCIAAGIGVVAGFMNLLSLLSALPESGPVAPAVAFGVMAQALALDGMFATMAAECQ